MRECFRVDSRSGIGNGQHDILTGPGTRVMPDVALVEFPVGRFYTQLPTRRHCVTRIDRQIHDHLFDLPVIGLDSPKVCSQRSAYRNVLANKPRKHFQHVSNQVVQIQNGRRKYLLAAESKQLPGKRRGALARFFNFLGVFAQRTLRIQFPLEQLAVPDDHAEQVIEIVSDSTRKPPDRFHFGGHLQLALQNSLLGHVLCKYV